jgi:Ran GTPase-activating protein (RanGAP) involved in mRNA processing and transport
MTLIHVKDEKITIRSLYGMIDRASKLDVIKLEEVELDGTEHDITNLAKVLRGHYYLEEFSLTSVTLTDSSLTLDEVVSMLLVTVPDLMLVKLEKAPISSSALATAGYCTSLKTLLVPNSGLTDEDAIKLAKAVAQSPSIQCIDISGNDLSDLGCVAFANALEKNTSIQTIRLEGNGKICGESRSLIDTTLRKCAGGRAHAA